MDLHRILEEMHAERNRLETIIANLEGLQARAADATPQRGRKGMNSAARKAASLRMKRYWEARKQQAEAEPVTHP
jgi:hypothetical protein